MDESDYGRFVPRGGEKIEVAKAADAFTAIVRGERDVATLAAPDAVRAVRSLTAARARPYLVEATVVEQDRDAVMDELRRDHGLVVHHEYVTADESGTRIRITDEIIAEFAEGTSTETAGAILEAAGVVIKKDYGPRSYLLVVTDAAGGNPIKVANRLESYDEVVYAEPVLMNRFAASAVPSDQQFRAQWHLSSANQTAPDIARDADVSVLGAWNTTKGRREIVVAVLDDGFDLTHPDFQDSEWFGHGRVNAAAAVAEAVRRLPAGPTVIDRERADRIAIPDADRGGISSTLEIAEVATIASVTVELDITHPWIGDLLVSLISPAGTSVTLHAGMGAGTDDIRRTYTAAEAPGLGWLAGSQAQGTWRLNVADRARRDVGALNRWRLRLTTA